MQPSDCFRSLRVVPNGCVRRVLDRNHEVTLRDSAAEPWTSLKRYRSVQMRLKAVIAAFRFLPLRVSILFWTVVITVQWISLDVVTAQLRSLSVLVLLPLAVFIGALTFLVSALAAGGIIRRPLTRAIWRVLDEDGYPTCSCCGYDLTGNVVERCTECGAVRSACHTDHS